MGRIARRKWLTLFDVLGSNARAQLVPIGGNKNLVVSSVAVVTLRPAKGNCPRISRLRTRLRTLVII